MVDEDQVGTPLETRPPRWFAVGCALLIAAAITAGVLLVLWIVFASLE